MNHEKKIYLAHTAAGFLSGMIAGAANLSAPTAFSLLLFSYLLSSALILKLKKVSLEEISGLSTLYKTGIGISLGTFLLSWILIFNLSGASPQVFFINPELGVHEVPEGVKILNTTYRAYYVIESYNETSAKIIFGVYSSVFGNISRITNPVNDEGIKYVKNESYIQCYKNLVLKLNETISLPWLSNFSVTLLKE